MINRTASSQLTHRHCFNLFSWFFKLDAWLGVHDRLDKEAVHLVLCVTVAIRGVDFRIVGAEQRNRYSAVRVLSGKIARRLSVHGCCC